MRPCNNGPVELCLEDQALPRHQESRLATRDTRTTDMVDGGDAGCEDRRVGTCIMWEIWVSPLSPSLLRRTHTSRHHP